MFDKGHVLKLGSNEYQLLETLPTQGGHAQVWRAELLGQTGTFVVKYPYLKRISSAAGRKHVDDFIQRAKTEIALLQKFTPDAASNHICPLHDSGIVATRYGDLPVLVLPYLSGKFPEAIVDEKVTYNASTALRWLREITMALKYLHDPQQHCLIHRDLKPANILLDDSGDIRLIDLGITKPERQANGETTSSMLSDKWAAPEQIIPVDMSEEGEWLYRLHTSMDIYALGLIAYYLFSKGKVIAYQAHVEGKHTSRRNSYWNRKPARLPWEDALVALAELETKGIKDGKDERQFLQGVKALLATEYAYMPPGGTLIGAALPMLPDAAWVADYLWEHVVQCLNPLPEKRPDAQQVLDCLKQVEAALHPTLQTLSLSATSEPVILGEQPLFMVELEGRNLPPIGSWLEVDWGEAGDFANTQAVQWQVIDPQPTGGLVNGKLRLQLQLPAMQKAGDFLLEVSARVWQQDMLSASHAFTVVQTPQQLWERGDKQAAVMLDPRPEWLDAMEKQLEGLGSAHEHLCFLQALCDKYPDHEGLAQRFSLFSQFQPRKSAKPQTLLGGSMPKKPLYPWVWALVGLLTGSCATAIIAYAVMPSPQQPARGLLTVPIATNSLNSDVEKELDLVRASLATQQKENDGLKSLTVELEAKVTEQTGLIATREKELASLPPTQNAPPTVLEQVKAWLEVDRNVKAQLAQLEPLAAAGDSEAMRILGVVYAAGKGVTANKAKGCEWLKKATAAGNAQAKLAEQSICR